jgi:hypothetical protein
MVAQTVLSARVRIPLAASASSILRVRYVSYNPLEVDPATNTDAIFYNCADIAIVAAGEGQMRAQATPAPAAQAEPLSAGGDYSCVTPPVWRAKFTESNSYGFVQHEIFWSSVSNFTRWDQAGDLDASGPSILSLINNYSPR